MLAVADITASVEAFTAATFALIAVRDVGRRALTAEARALREFDGAASAHVAAERMRVLATASG